LSTRSLSTFLESAVLREQPFPKLSKAGKVGAFRLGGRVLTTNSIRELEDAEKQLRNQAD